MAHYGNTVSFLFAGRVFSKPFVPEIIFSSGATGVGR
jgi:hypothetical protein